MIFSYASSIRRDFPELATRLLSLEGLVPPEVPVAGTVAGWLARARERIGRAAESEFVEIQAWRRAFAKMGLKPTQYRCASEALLRRLRKEGDLPSVHPLVDLCNAASVAHAIPIAAIDLDRINGKLEVRSAAGTERYETFAGETEHPDVGEVVFVDDLQRAHARRWTNRQSGYSAVRAGTVNALIVAEAMHETAAPDVARLMDELRAAIAQHWPSASLAELEPR